MVSPLVQQMKIFFRRLHRHQGLYLEMIALHNEPFAYFVVFLFLIVFLILTISKYLALKDYSVFRGFFLFLF